MHNGLVVSNYKFAYVRSKKKMTVNFFVCHFTPAVLNRTNMEGYAIEVNFY